MERNLQQWFMLNNCYRGRMLNPVDELRSNSVFGSRLSLPTGSTFVATERCSLPAAAHHQARFFLAGPRI
jgi:hypothetical protein